MAIEVMAMTATMGMSQSRFSMMAMLPPTSLPEDGLELMLAGLSAKTGRDRTRRRQG
ncbi:MAG: hypothetical protein ACRDGT_01080 [Candidatus Limnocylindria bacterium]